MSIHSPLVHIAIALLKPDTGILSDGKPGDRLSRCARELLHGLWQSVLPDDSQAVSFEKDVHGRPRPLRGMWWSVSHKPSCVMAALSAGPVGVDVEVVRPVSPGLWKKVASEGEMALWPEQRESDFFWCFVIKEAALKAVGQGLSGLSKCRIHGRDAVGNWHGETGAGFFRVYAWQEEEHVFAVSAERSAVRRWRGCQTVTPGQIPGTRFP